MPSAEQQQARYIQHPRSPTRSLLLSSVSFLVLAWAATRSTHMASRKWDSVHRPWAFLLLACINPELNVGRILPVVMNAVRLGLVRLLRCKHDAFDVGLRVAVV